MSGQHSFRIGCSVVDVRMIANGPGVDEVRILFAANLPCVAEMTIIANDPGVVPPKGLKNGTSYKKLYELQSIRTTFVWVRDVCLVDRFLKRIQAFRGFVTTRREGSTITQWQRQRGQIQPARFKNRAQSKTLFEQIPARISDILRYI
uniref:(northern house mosquito) hypothetical protein n=2 Tax=Culex pipiens TaxID=7175 RepID=A0A8D8FH13_CULPI